MIELRGDASFCAQSSRPTSPGCTSFARHHRYAAAWHSHAVGQTLYVTEGRGLHQARGGQIEEIRAGDIVHTPPTNGTDTAPHPTTS
jgi:mannose-6-phosphate isomerase-like protein (cupin superfamily)